MNKPARGIPRKTAQWDDTEIFSLSISIAIFKQGNSVYTTGSSIGFLTSLQRNAEALILVQKKGPGRIPG